MLIDCDACSVRGPACGDCVVSVVLGAPPEGVEVDDTERRALEVLAGSGLVPRLRLHTVGGHTVGGHSVGGHTVGGHTVDPAGGGRPARRERAAG